MLKHRILRNLLGLSLILVILAFNGPTGCNRGYSQTRETPSAPKTGQFIPVDNEYSVSVTQKLAVDENQGRGQVLVTEKINDFDRDENILEVNIVVENNSNLRVTLLADSAYVLVGEDKISIQKYECSTDRTLTPDEVTGCRVYFVCPEDIAKAMDKLKVVFDIMIGTEKQTVENDFVAVK